MSLCSLLVSSTRSWEATVWVLQKKALRNIPWFLSIASFFDSYVEQEILAQCFICNKFIFWIQRIRFTKEIRRDIKRSYRLHLSIYSCTLLNVCTTLLHTLFNVRALILVVTCFLWCTGTYVRISCSTWSTMHGMFL